MVIRHRRSWVLVVTGVAVGSCCLTVLAGPVQAAPTKGAPPLPVIGQYSKSPSRPVSGADLAKLQAKEDNVAGYIAQRAARVARADAMQAAALSSANLGEVYYQQINESYCGPATFSMVVDYNGVGWSGTATQKQYDAASLLGTTSANGTAWYGSDNVPSYPGTSWYPMQDAMNYRLYKAGAPEWYAVQALPGSPTSAQQSAFVSNLVYDIDQMWPEMDNQYSVPGYQLPYQPNGTWYHWWSARGYESSGAVTGINDPAQWSNNQEHWVTTTGGAHTVVVALGGRGYIW
jgi:hypothetical protein